MDNKRKAVIYMVLSTLFFTMMQIFVKLLTQIPTMEKVLFRNAVSLIVALIILLIYKKPLMPQKGNGRIVFYRCLFGLMGIICYFYGLEHLVMSNATMLNKLSPFFVTIFATVFLKEKLQKGHYLILIMVFTGTLLIIKPRFDFSFIPSLVALFSALFAGGAYTILRFLKDKEDPFTIVFNFSLFSVICLSPFAITNFVIPDINQFIYLLMIGVFAALGQFCITLSYKYAPAAEVSVYNYLSVVFALILGFIVFGELPDIISFIGTMIVIIMAVLNYKLMKN